MIFITCKMTDMQIMKSKKQGRCSHANKDKLKKEISIQFLRAKVN